MTLANCRKTKHWCAPCAPRIFPLLLLFNVEQSKTLVIRWVFLERRSSNKARASSSQRSVFLFIFDFLIFRRGTPEDRQETRGSTLLNDFQVLLLLLWLVLLLSGLLHHDLCVCGDVSVCVVFGVVSISLFFFGNMRSVVLIGTIDRDDHTRNGAPAACWTFLGPRLFTLPFVSRARLRASLVRVSLAHKTREILTVFGFFFCLLQSPFCPLSLPI